jgi:hypothetical protein
VADKYQAAIFFLVGRSTAAVGNLDMNTISNDGSLTLQTDGDCGGANVGFVLAFRPFGTLPSQPEIQVGTLSADANSKLSGSLQFPQKGNFAGVFEIELQNFSGPDFCMSTGPDPFSPTLSYSAPLLPASSISGGIGATTGMATGNGMVSLTGNSAQVSLTSAAAAHNFSVAWCGSTMNNCTDLGTLTTDAQGIASGSFSMAGTGTGGSFVLSDSAGVEYISGFHVQ